MALSLRAFTGVLSGETMSFPRLSAVTPLVVHAKLRSVRMVTFATASESVSETKKREPRGITAPRRVSPEMQAFLGGVPEIPRTKVLKEIWAYIKQHNLQDPKNKKIIVCDNRLKKIFAGKDRVGFLEIAGLITPHFLK